MLAAGFDVMATDGSPELARKPKSASGRPVKVLLFEDIDFTADFDAVWANACLLHAPKPSLPAILGKVHAALKTDGVFYASFKTGADEGYDRFGRYYNYPDQAYLHEALGPERWSSITITQRAGGGYCNLPAEWLHMTAIKA